MYDAQGNSHAGEPAIARPHGVELDRHAHEAVEEPALVLVVEALAAVGRADRAAAAGAVAAAVEPESPGVLRVEHGEVVVVEPVALAEAKSIRDLHR